MSAQRSPASRTTEAAIAGGILPHRGISEAINEGWISSPEPYGVTPAGIQPASLDLRLGEYAWELQCSFLPDSRSTVEQKLQAIDHERFQIAGGRTLERDRAYLIPLLEELKLPKGVRAKANPKSSTGRLDVFTRVITDRNSRFDEIRDGYHGRLYLEVVPRSFAVKVDRFQSLNQLRLMTGDARVSDEELRRVHTDECPLLYSGETPVRAESLTTSEGLFLSVDLTRPDEIAGYRAKKNSRRIDLSKIRNYLWREFWEPVTPERNGHIILQPEDFYLLLSAEGVCVPPGYAAEMMAYDPTAGELRTHYAGFFDPGFGFGPQAPHGTRAALEVRARDVAFMLEHGQAICKLAFERMLEPTDRLYGEAVGSHYQGQDTMLSKHFIEPPGPPVREERQEATLFGEQASMLPGPDPG